MLGDGRVFLRSDEESHPGFTVDLMLDGSASRASLSGDHRRAGVYSGEKPEQLRVPVRITSFCSLRGYTVFGS